MIRLLKLSTNKEDRLSSEDILSIHLGYYLSHGKVAYSTDIAVAEKPDYVLLTLGNVEDICYVCKVEDYAYKDNARAKSFYKYTPDVYKDEERKTWLLFNHMQRISVNFLDELIEDPKIKNFIKERANNKTIK